MKAFDQFINMSLGERPINVQKYIDIDPRSPTANFKDLQRSPEEYYQRMCASTQYFHELNKLSKPADLDS